MIVEGKNTVTLFNDFDARNQSITKKLKGTYDDEFKKELLKKAQHFAIDDDVPTDPNIDDFEFVPFRHISKTIVGAGSYKATDFSTGNVLKESVAKLDGVNAYTNHFAYVGNEIGKVLNPVWSNGFTNKKGEKVPPGINAPFVIDKILHPKLVRALKSPVGSPIDSASVTVLFYWKASHDFEREYDFFYHLGEEIDGEMVRRIAEQVEAYEESSLVWSGADPYAKILERSGALEKESKSAQNKFSANPDLAKYDSGRTFFIMESQNEAKILNFDNASLSFSNNFPNNKNDSPMKKEIILLMAAALGMKSEDVEKLSKEELEQKLKFVKVEDFTALEQTKEKVTQLEGEKTALESEKTTLQETVKNLTSEKTALEADAKIGKTVLAQSRTRAKELYNKFANGKPDAKIEKEIEEATDIESLEAKAKMFGGKLFEAFGAKCSECGSGKVEFRSSKEDIEDEDDDKKTKTVPLYMAARQ